MLQQLIPFSITASIGFHAMRHSIVICLSIAVTLFLSTGCGQPKTGIAVSTAPDGSVDVLVQKDGMIDHEANTFLAAVDRKDDVIVVVDFWAEWCGPCKMLAPELQKVKKEWGDKISIVKVDVDLPGNQELARFFELNAIPRLIVFRSGRSIADVGGYVSATEMNERLRQLE